MAHYSANGAMVSMFLALLLAACRPSKGMTLVADSKANPASPVNKVVELLGVLGKQLQEEHAKDEHGYTEFAHWIAEEEKGMKSFISAAQETIQAAEESQKQEEALAVSKRNTLDKTAGRLAHAEKELVDAKDVREQEQKTFEKNEAECVEAVDQFQRALEVMAKKQPDAAFLESTPKSGVGLLHIAQKLRDTFKHSDDITLSDSQRDLLHDFFRLAARGAKEEVQSHKQEESAQPSLDFLQLKSKRSGQAEDAGGDNGGVAQTLQGVLSKTQVRLQEVREQESEALANYKPMTDALSSEIEGKKQTMNTLKMEISQHEQKTGELKSVILAGEQKVKVTQGDLTNLQGEAESTKKSYEVRRQKRSDEILAVKEAGQILSSQGAKEAFKAAASLLQVGQSSSPVSLVQVRQTSRLAARSHRQSGGEPFGKIKNMIAQMLRKLQDQHADEQKKSAWCDGEMSKSKASQDLRLRDVQKVTDRIEEMDAELEQLGNDINTMSRELSDLNKSTIKAQQIRSEESERAGEALAHYGQAHKLVNEAIAVLQKYYAQQQEKEAAAANDKHDFKPSTMGSQVIGILEVAQEDYAQLEEGQQQAEEASQKDFNNFMNDNSVRKAVYEKDLEYKSRAKTKNTSERMRSTEDLKNYQKELDAIGSYLEELKASCTIKGDSYDERTAKRQSELESLREALTYLKQ